MDQALPSTVADSSNWRALFTGRREEINKVLQSVDRSRLGVILGPYGSGKTTLALATAEALRPRFESVRIVSVTSNTAWKELRELAVRPRRQGRLLLVVDEVDQVPAEFIGRLLELVRKVDWLSLILVGALGRHLVVPASVTLGGFSKKEAYAFAARAAHAAGVEFTPADLRSIVSATDGHPRLLAAALQIAADERRNPGELSEFLGRFNRSGLVDPQGRPLRSTDPQRRALVSDIKSVNQRVLERVREDPMSVRRLSPREFEELVAEVLSRQGYEVQLTPPTKDGGFDIFAAHKTTLGSFLFLVECKRYSETNRVGVEVVRALHGVVQEHGATAGIVATTSFFTTGATAFQRRIPHQMSLRDYVTVQEWLATTF